jgi:hypothetical protein
VADSDAPSFPARIAACKTRAEAAQVYYEALDAMHSVGVLIDWPGMNKAALKKWKPSGVNWIKEQAWKKLKL